MMSALYVAMGASSRAVTFVRVFTIYVVCLRRTASSSGGQEPVMKTGGALVADAWRATHSL